MAVAAEAAVAAVVAVVAVVTAAVVGLGAAMAAGTVIASSTNRHLYHPILRCPHDQENPYRHSLRYPPPLSLRRPRPRF